MVTVLVHRAALPAAPGMGAPRIHRLASTRPSAVAFVATSAADISAAESNTEPNSTTGVLTWLSAFLRLGPSHGFSWSVTLLWLGFPATRGSLEAILSRLSS